MTFLASIQIDYNSFWQAPVYLLSCFVLFAIGKIAFQLFHPSYKVDHEMVEKDNFAFAVAHIGYYAGLLIAITGVMSGEGDIHLGRDLFLTLEYGLASIVLLNISLIINDKILLKEFKLVEEITGQLNVGTGIVAAANSIATGLLIYGVLSVDAEHELVALAFWAIGQVMLMLSIFLYKSIVKHNVHDLIEKKNIAVALAYAGVIIAIANIVRFGIATDHSNWTESIVYLLAEVGLGLLMLPIIRVLTDKVLLPKRNMNDEILHQEIPNIGVGLFEAFAYIGGSILIIHCL